MSWRSNISTRDHSLQDNAKTELESLIASIAMASNCNGVNWTHYPMDGQSNP